MDNNPSWFDRSIYIPSPSADYWKLMIGKRIYLREFVNGKTNRKYTQKIGMLRFNDLIRITAEQSHPTLSPEQSFIRNISSTPKLKPAFVLRQLDIEHLAHWSDQSPEFTEQRNTAKELFKNMLQTNHKRLKRTAVDLQPNAEIWQEYDRIRNSEITEFPDWMNRFATKEYTPIMVNLSKPLNEIMKDIAIIKKTYDTQGKLLRDLEKEFRTWHKFGLLAYFDLKLWSKISGNRIPNSEIYRLIWPPEKQPSLSEETLKKTTTRYIRKVFTEATLNKL